MKLNLELDSTGVQYTSEHNVGKGKWIQTKDGFVQVLVLAVDDSSLYTEGKQWVHVMLKVQSPEELA